MTETDSIEIPDDWALEIEMSDGSRWRVPVETIARHRAAHYADEFDGDVERSLREDTLPHFRASHYAVTDWATGNMNWSDVAADAERVAPPAEPDFQREWVRASKRVVGTPTEEEG